MVAPRGWVNGAVATVRRGYPAAAVEFDAYFPDDEACAVSLAWLRWGDDEFLCQLFAATKEPVIVPAGAARTPARVRRPVATPLPVVG
jgi:hypothetical protein